jgi:hypothetical protein
VSVLCPQGHPSDDPDFCDTCGAKVGGRGAVDPADELRDPVATMPCPRCGTMRLADDQFCEDCGFDFLDPAALATGADRAETTAPIDDERPTWRAVISADRDQFDRAAPDDTDFPVGLEPRVVVLERDCIRIGRRSDARGPHPEIDLAGPPADIFVSRVHAVLNRQDDGSYTLVDKGSANGTTVNRDATPLVEGAPHALGHGDEIHVGAWTTITILRDPEPA